jgi:hypothetical protein
MESCPEIGTLNGSERGRNEWVDSGLKLKNGLEDAFPLLSANINPTLNTDPVSWGLSIAGLFTSPN